MRKGGELKIQVTIPTQHLQVPQSLLFLGTSPLTMVSAFVVSPKTHLLLELSPHTLQASSTYAWQQHTYFLCTMCMYSAQHNICSNSQSSWVICQSDKAKKKNTLCTIRSCCHDFFEKNVDDYYSACTYLQLPYFKDTFFKFLSKQPLVPMHIV